MMKLPPDARCIMLACRNIKNELFAALAEAEGASTRLSTSGGRFPVIFVPQESHLFPEKLRTNIQGLIDSITNVDYILLPMGRCGNGTLGLVSETAHLVLPKCNDCIDLLLSGNTIQSERPTRSYFLTEGWLGSSASIDNEAAYTMNKYGEEKGRMIINMIYEHYEYFTIVDTGAYDTEATKQKIAPLARMAEMKINTLPGPAGVLRKMVKLEFDENFIIVPPGQAVNEAHFA